MSARSLYPLLLFLITIGSAAQQTTDTPAFFVRTIVQKPEFIKGDSTLVSFVLYSEGEIRTASCKQKALKVKGARARRLNINRETTRGRGRWENRLYNTLVWAQYIVAADAVGTLTLPAIDFRATVRLYERSADPFAEFFGYRRGYKDFEVSASSAKTKISVTEKPKKTTQEIMRARGGIL
ncbi:MAG: BatD family protein [Alloprevotella sp.]|nr:BatD family protein [Alloprevotella sp.]